MLRYRLSLLLALLCVFPACSILVDKKLDDKNGTGGKVDTPDAGMDATDMVDASDDGGDVVMVDCLGMKDGTMCGSGLICFGGLCKPSECGDGYIDTNMGEDCEEETPNLDDTDGCTSQCTFTCKANADCADAFPFCLGMATCNTESHQCEQGTQLGNGTDCPVNDTTGECQNGVCVPPDCGNNVLDDGEECDPSSGMGGATNQNCTAACNWVCETDGECSDDLCLPSKCTNHMCVDEDPIECEPSDKCKTSNCEQGTCIEKFKDDNDGDGYGSDAVDCDDEDLEEKDSCDNDPKVNPGEIEQCDDADNDCDGSVDENTENQTWYIDEDGDGFGSGDKSQTECSQPNGYVNNKNDCDDSGSNASSVYPGQTTYFSTPRASRCTSTDVDCWDYNCDGKITPRFGLFEKCSGGQLTCSQSGGFEKPTACGRTGAYIGCQYIPGIGGITKGFCTAVQSGEREQRCR